MLRRCFGDRREFLDHLLAGDLQFVELVIENDKTRPAFGMPVLDLLHKDRLLGLDGCKLCGQFVSAGRGALQLGGLVCDHLLGNAVEDIERVEGDRKAVENALLKFLASNCLAVAAAGAAEVIDRKTLLAVGAAIAILARDRVGATAFLAFEHPTQKIFRSVCCVEPVGGGVLVEIANNGVACADALP
ncbi:hypothetical protein PCC82_12530 [Agrobacterium deltaense]